MGVGSRVKRMLRRISQRHLPWDAEIVALQAKVAELEARCTDLIEAARDREERFESLAERDFALEQLLTASPAARPPGADAAVRALGDPAVAVILPTYNRARFVADAIRSVQAQSFRAFELVVVDDGGEDDTEAVVGGFADDRRIRYIRKLNGGSSSARNLGVERSTAPLIAYIDSDNVWYPDFLAIAVDHLAANPDHDFVYGALVTSLHSLPSSRILWRPFDRAALEQANFIDTNVVVHRRSLVARYGGWDPKLSALNDWDLALRYTADTPAVRLAALAAYYRKCDDIRATDRGGQSEETASIRTKLGLR